MWILSLQLQHLLVYTLIHEFIIPMCVCVCACVSCIAPSAAPTSVSVSEVTSSSITVQWGAVPCIDRNGDITGYSVQYGSETMSVSGDFSGGMYVISNLEPSAFYSIQVAAMNDDLIGPYSTALDQLTEGKYITSYTVLVVYIISY